MGGKQSTEEKLEVLNSTSVQNSLSNINENVTDITMEIMQKNVQKTSAGSDINQKQKMGDVIAAGKGATVKGSQEQATDVKITVKALQETKMQNDIAKDLMNQLQTKLEEQMSMTQEQAQKDGEQMVSEIMGALTAAIPGAKSETKSDTSIKNILDIQSEVELKNIVKQAVNIDMVTESVQEMVSSLSVAQEQEVGKLAALGDDSLIEFTQNQSVTTDQVLEAVSKSGITSKMISSVANVSEGDVKKAIEAGQSNKQEKEGTLGGFAGVIDSTFGGMSQLGGTMMLPIIIVGSLMVLGVMVYFMSGSSTPPPPQYGGGLAKSILSIPMMILKYIRKIIKKVFKIKLPKVDKDMIINGLLLSIASMVVLEILKKKKENFQFSKLTERKLKVEDQYINDKLCLGSEGMELKINNATDEYIYLFNNKDEYLKIDGNKISLEKYNLDNDLKYQLKHEKDGYRYKISRNDKYLKIKDNCLGLTEFKNAATLFEIE